MPARRLIVSVCALAALLAATLPVAAGAFPLGALAPASPAGGSWQASASVREQLRSSGVYDLSVTVTTPADAGKFVNVEIGPLARRAKIDIRRHRASLKLRLAISARAFTVRVTANRVTPLLRVSLRWIGEVAAGTAPSAIEVAKAPTGDAAPGKGTTRSSGGASKPAKTTSSAPAAASRGATAATGSTGATGASGASTPATPAPAPPPPAPLVPTTGPNGNPIIAVPANLAPVINYSTPVEDYEFDGPGLPVDWSPGTWSYGFDATLFTPSQVSMTGSSVALTATDQASGGYPYQSGWISTEGGFSLTHGLIDFRAEMPAGQGLWSGLWLDQPDNSNPWGEIDVQEMLLADTHTVYATVHNWAPDPRWAVLQSTVMADDASQGFHDYQVVWQPGMITWAVDGVAYAQYTEAEAAANGQPWPFDDGTGYYLIADLAVAGPSEWGGPPDSSTVFPATMQIQSIKVWE